MTEMRAGTGRPMDAGLARLRQRLLDMGGVAEEMVRDSVLALRRRDAALAESVVARDEQLDAMEVELDDACILLLALRQPLARDLRLVTMAMKIANDLERVGDHAVSIAFAVPDLLDRAFASFPEIGEMCDVAMEMLTDSLDHFIRADAVRARGVLERDEAMDALQDTFLRSLLRRMAEDPRWIGPGLSLLVVGRNLERIADLATNIAEDVIYLVDGEPAPPRRTRVVGETA